MKSKTLLLALSAGMTLLLNAPAQAITIGSVNSNGNEVDTSFSTSSMLSVDIGAKNSKSVSVQVLTEAGDPAVLALNGLVRNLMGLGLPHVDLTLSGASFANLGTAAGNFGSAASVAGGSNWARISLVPAENFELAYGDWFLAGGSASDFGIRVAEGASSFTLSVTAVPEPGTWALLVGGLAVIGAWGRRRTAR